MSVHHGRAALLPTGLLLLLLAACSGAQAGTARIAADQPAVGSVTVPESGPAPATAPQSVSGSGATSRASPTDSAVPPFSRARVRYGPPGVPSPTGEVVLRLDGDLTCFVPAGAMVGALAGEVGTCASLIDGEKLRFVSFSPDGGSLLFVAGPDERHSAVYVMDSATAEARVIGPDAIEAPSATPPRWDLSTVNWSVDGSRVLIVLRTDTADAAVVAADPRAGGVTELGRLPADLANGAPDLRSTRRGVALVAGAGPERGSLWWLPTGRTVPVNLGRFADAGGSLYLITADPQGRIVLACPLTAAGGLGEIVAVDVESGQARRALSDSSSCAGAAFSPDGSVAALTATVAGGYSLLLVDVVSGARLLTVPLPVPEPKYPPPLTWNGKTIVVIDGTGRWLTPSLIITLR